MLIVLWWLGFRCEGFSFRATVSVMLYGKYVMFRVRVDVKGLGFVIHIV